MLKKKRKKKSRFFGNLDQFTTAMYVVDAFSMDPSPIQSRQNKKISLEFQLETVK